MDDIGNFYLCLLRNVTCYYEQSDFVTHVMHVMVYVPCQMFPCSLVPCVQGVGKMFRTSNQIFLGLWPECVPYAQLFCNLR